MPKIIIADTSFLIAIEKLELFDQIRDLYNEIFITKTIAAEFGHPLPDWVKIQEPFNPKINHILSFILDKGEASAIALAFDFTEIMLIIAELKARKEALKFGFRITGTFRSFI